MDFRNSKERYGILAQVLHWFTAVLVFTQIPIGLYAANLPVSMARLQWLSYHKSIGFTTLMLMVFRLIWRLIDPPPAMPDTMPQRERNLARNVHCSIYIIFFMSLLSGWMHASAAGLSINWFGLILIPDLVSKSSELAALFKTLHHGSVLALVLLLIGHIGAALRHALVLRDYIASRMLPESMFRMKK